MQRNKLKEAVYVGDTQGDYDATVAAGIPFIYARYGFGQPERYDHAIDQLPDLLNMA
jgi:phosphoglycolate phosphatase